MWWERHFVTVGHLKHVLHEHSGGDKSLPFSILISQSGRVLESFTRKPAGDLAKFYSGREPEPFIPRASGISNDLDGVR